ncbi:hypothetical protein [Litorilituus lipolyticus]|uniref:Glycerophosphoryl diester phosphodiesterase membrane domain-containing protein n=1 Tax=Litorilituus lipolyticus TaxID=2491017 RepID=A0A502KWK1_9GAMM|nr:hypothetical protein [Litorilituus lipolyticus]TPH15896.1 hypothetical protein EPA86_07970 [Litorilituus lipolyticus]
MSDKISVIQIGGSVERAEQGDYQLDTKAIFSEAWQYTLKARVSIMLGLAFAIFLGMLVSYIASDYLGGMEAVIQDPQAGMILNILVTVIIWPFLAGVEMMGVFHAVGMKTHVSLVFSFLKRGSWVAICALLTSSLISIGFQLFIFPGIFLAVVLSLTIPLVVEKQMTPMKAIVLSVKALRFKWWQLTSIYMLLVICLLGLIFPIVMLVDTEIAPISIILFIFGMTYLAPLYYNVKGILYREIFGVQIATNKPIEASNGQEEENSDNNASINKDGPDDTFSA